MLFNRPKPFSLTIDNPCLQSWDDMQMARDGKFCAHCSKTVVDFTQMSDAALFDYVKKNGLGCGRFRASQLERTIAPPVSRKKIPGIKWMAGILFFFGWLKEGSAQSQPHKKINVAQSPSGKKQAVPKSKRNTELLISGMLTRRWSHNSKDYIDEMLDTNLSTLGAYGGPIVLNGPLPPHHLPAPNKQEIPLKYRKRSFWREIQFWKK